MRLIYFLSSVIILISSMIYAAPIDDAWAITCGLISSINMFVGLTCSALQLTYNASKEAGDKHLTQIPAGKCKELYVYENGLTEVCSSGGNRLYFDPRGYTIRGCYHFGKAGTSSFTECCQLKHKRFYNGHAWHEHMGEFCSGPHGKYVNPNGLDKYNVGGANESLLMYRNSRMQEECALNYYGKNCQDAQWKFSQCVKEEVKWNKAKNIPY